MTRTMIELLAPAGSRDALIAAVSAGADAVYLGGNRFGARHFAGNFSDEEIVEAVSYAHMRGVSIFVTVNTLIHDTEINDLIEYLVFLAETGVDAIIIQDLGVLSLARNLFRDIEKTPACHASTQMSIHNLEGARFAQSKGCRRVVLARELPSREIQQIGDAFQNTGGEIEIFGHGALCYAYSGQCLLSAVIGGRSGNRGMCAQPCRKPYQLISGISDEYGRLVQEEQVRLPDRYLLSTRDLSIYPKLQKVSTLPISSIKIEGRMRSPSYVATVTSIYRRALDESQKGHFVPASDDEITLALAFSRGFTSGYLNEESYKTVMGRDLPGRRGVFIGFVTGADEHGWLKVDQAGDIIPERGDGLVCINAHDEQGFVLRKDPTQRGQYLLMDAGISSRPGDRIYLTSRGRTHRFFEELSRNPDHRHQGSIILDMECVISPKGQVTIQGDLTHRKVHTKFSFVSSYGLSPARTRPLTGDQIETSLRKTGGTLFSVSSLTVSCPEGLFAPVSVLNSIRREILDYVTELICKSYCPSSQDLQKIVERADVLTITEDDTGHDHAENLRIICIVSTLSEAILACKAGVDLAFIEWYPGSNTHHNATRDSLFEDIPPEYQNCIGMKIPRIMRRKELDHLYSCLSGFIQSGLLHIMVDSPGIGEEILSRHPGVKISGYTGLNLTNHLSLKTFNTYEFCTLSCELSGSEVAKTMDYVHSAGMTVPVALVVQGILETIITEDRLIDLIGSTPESDSRFALLDKKGQIFPCTTDANGRTHIFNAAETSLLESMFDLVFYGIRYAIIDARWRSEQYITSMIHLWNNARGIKPGPDARNQLVKYKEEARTYAGGVLTSGTWKRGLCQRPE